MVQSFLKDLDKDIRFPLGGRYFLKRYAYSKTCEGCWVDSNGKKIKERMFSFIIEHGNRWDNSTVLNFRESELHTVMDNYKSVLAKVKAERAELLIGERIERIMYPKKTTWKFGNVEIVAIENLAYTSWSNYPLLGKKSVSIYANGKPYRYGTNVEYDANFELTTDWMLEFISSHYTARYNTSNLNDSDTKYVNVKNHKKDKRNFLPYHFYIGYVIVHKGQQYAVRDVFTYSYRSGFVTDKGDIEVSPAELFGVKVVGEMQGVNVLSALIAKTKYCD